ncbi:MAG: hypothetical protein AAF467_03455 [Actinomycetota bacterium]
MTDLDIQIDVPDDDDLSSNVRVLGGDAIPPWLKAAAVLLIGGLLVLFIAAFLLGRSQGTDDPVAETTSSTEETTPIESAPASAAVERTLEAVSNWETFARTGEIGPVSEAFDPEGPQHAMLAASSIPPDPEAEFTARNLFESRDGNLTTVSMDLVVSGSGGRVTYPYDMVFIDAPERVWTVTDRRSPGTVALPPPLAVVVSAEENWSLFTSSMQIGDDAGVLDVVSQPSVMLGDRIAAAATSATDTTDSDATFAVLVDRARASNAQNAGDALIAAFDLDQRQTMLNGTLSGWTLVDEDRVVATLTVADNAVTTVPFVPAGDAWVVDLADALQADGGTS